MMINEPMFGEKQADSQLSHRFGRGVLSGQQMRFYHWSKVNNQAKQSSGDQNGSAYRKTEESSQKQNLFSI